MAFFLTFFFMPEDVHAANPPAPVFRSVLFKLRQARIPVYVPAWLPHFDRRVYPVVYVGPHGRTYELDLSYVPRSVGTATLAFDLTANFDVLPPGPPTRRIALGNGITGFVGSIPHTASDSLTVRWRQGGVIYAMGRLGPERDLIRCARSVVRLGLGASLERHIEEAQPSTRR